MSESSPEDTFDVVVAGMGPVGKMVALMLARKGHTVLVADKRASPYGLPRAVAHDAEIARILQSVQLPPDSMPDCVEPYDDLYVWVNADDETLLLIDWTGLDPSGWHNTYFYNQPGLEAHIDRKMREHSNVQAIRGSAVTVNRQDQSGVDVTLTDVESGRSRSLRAKYVLGADGANSDTRRAIDIGWTDLGYFFDWLVVDVIPGPDSDITHLAKQVADPKRPTTVVPAGPGKRRWEFMLLDGENPEEMAAPENIWKLLSTFGLDSSNASIERGVVYRFESGWASDWRRDRVILLGDAAHKMPPFAGQGLAAGFRDCLNLSWKLDLVLKGLAPDELLNTYGSERSPHVSDFINFSIGLGSIICITDPAQAAARDAAMLADRAAGRLPEPPPAPRLGEGLFTGDAGGYLSWQGHVTSEGQVVPERFDDEFGAGSLIVSDSVLLEGLDGETLERLASLGINVTTFGGPATTRAISFDDVEGKYAQWFAAIGAEAVLVRPDFYVYGTARTAPDVTNLARSFVSAVTGNHR